MTPSQKPTGIILYKIIKFISVKLEITGFLLHTNLLDMLIKIFIKFKINIFILATNKGFT